MHSKSSLKGRKRNKRVKKGDNKGKTGVKRIKIIRFKGKTLLAKIALWEKDVISRPEGINPNFLPALEMEKLGATK